MAKSVKMLIADDERLIRESLNLLMDWTSVGVEIVGVASDGIEALEKIRELAPRILLSDISMPKMDGIELIQSIKEESLRCHVIFLSAYSNFTYAQSAVKFGAFDYILKPIDENELLDTVRRCVQTVIDEEKGAAAPAAKSSSETGMASSAIKALVLKHRPLMSEEDVFLSAVGLDKSEDHRCIGALFCSKDKGDTLTVPPDPFGEGDGLTQYVVSVSEREKLLLWIDFSNNDRLERKFIRFLNEQLESMNGVFISDAHPVSEISRIYAECAFTQLCSVLGFDTSGHKFSDSAIIRGEEYPRVSMQELSRAIHNKEEATIKKLVDSMFWRFAQRGQIYDIDIVKLRCNERLDGLRDDLFLTDRTDGDTENNILITSKKLINMQFSVYDIYEETYAALLRFCNFLGTLDAYSGTKLVSQAVAIIKEEYPSVSLSSIADRLYISPTHLSRLFAAEKGETFSHYVQRYRMKIAKQLLADPKYKIYNVARMVGYSDVAHFSKAFKQQEGMSPLKYRNLSGCGDDAE